MNERINGWKWGPVVFLVSGVLLRWIHIDQRGIILGLGFLSFGIISLMDALRNKHHKKISIDTLQVVLPLIVIIAAIENVSGNACYIPTFAAIVLHSLIGQRKKFQTG